MKKKEKAAMILLDCDAKMKDDVRFGGVFAVNITNYDFFIIKCPHDCHLPSEIGNVYGLAIHPEDSSICMSALVDKSMPFTGGVIGMNVLSGLSKY